MITITKQEVLRNNELALSKFHRLVKEYTQSAYYKIDVSKERQKAQDMYMYCTELAKWEQDIWEQGTNDNYITEKGYLYLISNIRNV